MTLLLQQASAQSFFDIWAKGGDTNKDGKIKSEVCFEEQLLAPGERVQMPVSFYIDPDIENDMDGKFINQITLSYTFYQREIVESAAIMLENPQKVKLN